MSYLLDTNAWIAFLRQSQSSLIARIQAKRAEEICICSVVVAELFGGCLRSANPAANRKKVEYVSFGFDDLAADRFAEIRYHLERSGLPIGPYDMQIAAIALVNGCTLVTHNMREFARIPGLPVEDWELP